MTHIADSTQLGTIKRVKTKAGKTKATRTVAVTGDERREESEESPGNRKASQGGRMQSSGAEREKDDIKMEKEIAEHEVMEAEGRVQEMECRVREVEGKAREAEGRAREAEGRVRVAEGRVREAEGHAREAEGRARDAEGQAKVEEGRAREAECRAREAESRAREEERGKEMAQNRQQEMEQRLMESEGKLRRLQTQWVVERREIQLTDQELGRGAWATVSVAKFRGARVAAKCVHNQIVSQHNIQLFKREMDMAARIRHPNLLLFIGATLEGEMVILTELMLTSLRRELQKEYQLSPRLTISIGLDVARALNYLHLMRPHPLIHRDISSANVLLEPLPNGRWRAKVSDYGTVNLQENLATIGPGSPCYAAPEANDPTQQSPKMDIFSFGALLMEMLSGELTAKRSMHEIITFLLQVNCQPEMSEHV